MQYQRYAISFAGAVSVLLACIGGSSIAYAANGGVIYRAELLPLNAKVASSDACGEASFTISGDRLTIRISAKGVPPSMEHLQHFHGFATGVRAARCPTARDDKNGDGIIDLVETEPVAGTTMVPFHDDPVSMTIVNDTYPKAGADGAYIYEKTVPLKALEAAFTKAFPDQKLDLDRRVIFLHGVPAATELPATGASLDHIPSQVTLPIACGVIKKAAD